MAASRQQRRAQERAARKAERKRTNVARGAIAAGAMLAAGAASAATITVNSLADTTVAGDTQCTLREALNNANSNSDTTGGDCTAGSGADIIVFQSGLTGTITLGGTELPQITDSVTINGPGANVITISGNNLSRIVDIASKAAINVNINNLTLTHGSTSGYGGAVLDYEVPLTLDHVTVTGNTAAAGGGGVAFYDAYGTASMTITSSTITSNSSGDIGGGITITGFASTAGTVTISGTTISNNIAANDGGGVAFFGQYGNLALTMTGSTISGNTASNGDGGGIDVYYQYASVHFYNDTFTTNQSGGAYGGGVNVELRGLTADFKMLNSLVTNNTAGTLSSFSGVGGGIRVQGYNGLSALIQDSVISGNVGDANDVAAPSADTSIGYGGGLYLGGYLITTVQRTSITGNTAAAGGGVFVDAGSATFENVTIANNHAKNSTGVGYGGGVEVSGEGTTVALNEATIVGNDALAGGGGVDTYGFITTTLYDAIVAGNTDNGGTTPDVRSGTNATVNATYTLIQTPGTATIGGGTGNITGTSPNLGALGDNNSVVVAGDPSAPQLHPQTEVPNAGSPAINAGDPAFAPPPSTDERGLARIVGGRIDMGAAEVQPSITITAPPPTNEGNSGTTPFVFTVTLSTTSSQTVTVNYATADGTATAPSDYAAASGVVTFTPGQTTQQVTINVNGDTTPEANETFGVNLSSPVNATIATGTATATIVNDDTASLSINNVSQAEGNSGTTPFVFTVTLTPASALTVTVNYATAPGTATSPSDFASTTGTLTFTPGQTTQPITVNVVGDTTCEPNETFTVNLSSPSNAIIANGTGTGTIQNDDPCGTDLSITKTAPNPFAYATQTLTYTIKVTNNGPIAATSATVTDVLPPNTTFVAVTPSQGSCSGSSTVTCTLGTIAFPGSATITLSVTPTAAGNLSNAASVSTGAQPDTNTSNDSATASVNVFPAADIPLFGGWAKVLLAFFSAMIGLFMLKKGE